MWKRASKAGLSTPGQGGWAGAQRPTQRSGLHGDCEGEPPHAYPHTPLEHVSSHGAARGRPPFPNAAPATQRRCIWRGAPSRWSGLGTLSRAAFHRLRWPASPPAIADPSKRGTSLSYQQSQHSSHAQPSTTYRGERPPDKDPVLWRGHLHGVDGSTHRRAKRRSPLPGLLRPLLRNTRAP